MPHHLDVPSLVRQGRSAVSEARVSAPVARAWRLLHETAGSGAVLPWTAAALVDLEAAHAQAPDDHRVLHHLAIAHHARAWDLEVSGDPGAAEAWERALGLWREVAACTAFWDEKERKLLACDASADVAVLRTARRDLLEHLLDIHVDFIRHYCEAGNPQRAARHVETIRRARVAPALRQRLVDKVFVTMTAAVPEAKQRQAFAPALTTVERFLALFPDHLQALRLHAELCLAWLSGLSFRDDWEEILTVDRTARSLAARLAVHPDLQSDPQAPAVLAHLAGEMVRRGNNRADGLCDQPQPAAPSPAEQQERRAIAAAFQLACAWGRLGQAPGPGGEMVKALLVHALHNHAVFLDHEAVAVLASTRRSGDGLASALALYRQGLAETVEALALAADTDGLNNNRTAFEQRIAALEKEQTQRELFS